MRSIKKPLVLSVATGTTFERCVQMSFLLDEVFMHAAEHQNQTSRTGKVAHYGLIVRFQEAKAFTSFLFPQDKAFNAAHPHILQRLGLIIEWFAPHLNEEKINRYTALRCRIVDDQNQVFHQIQIFYPPTPLSSHERAEHARQLRDLLFAHFSADEVTALLEHISPSG